MPAEIMALRLKAGFVAPSLSLGPGPVHAPQPSSKQFQVIDSMEVASGLRPGG